MIDILAVKYHEEEDCKLDYKWKDSMQHNNVFLPCVFFWFLYHVYVLRIYGYGGRNGREKVE